MEELKNQELEFQLKSIDLEIQHIELQVASLSLEKDKLIYQKLLLVTGQYRTARYAVEEDNYSSAEDEQLEPIFDVQKEVNEDGVVKFKARRLKK